MPADYEAIRAENIGRYGWDTAVLDLLGRLYSERTHFIFELIQNAEDAGATELGFELFADRLEVRHDGRPFNETDVRGICGVGKSTKAEDLTQIGKFGIGFKSVYAYTETPRVHCADEHFRIELYVRPHSEIRRDVPSGETLQVFPFDRGELPAAVAVEEISAALNSLELRTMLFLRHIGRVRVGGVAIAGGVLERCSTTRSATSRHVALTETFDDRHGGEEWLVWHRNLDDLGEAGRRVEIAFPATTDNGRVTLEACDESPLVVFFPTEKETFLGFLIQGPYRTTPARDNIPPHDPSNRSLVAETAILLHEVLTALREEGLLSVGILQAMPLDPTRFQEASMFRPLFDATRNAFLGEALIPLADGGYGKAAAVKLARGAGLRDLLAPGQLRALYGTDTDAAFADDSITENRTPLLRQYLREQLGVDEVTPEAVLGKTTRSFLEAQPDEWIGRFYGFLHQNPALWRNPRWAGSALNKPIIRLEDGRHIAPFNDKGDPNAYLPGTQETEFPTVRRAVADAPDARQFLEALKFTEPDVVAEVFEKVLPRYTMGDPTDVDPGQHLADIERIARAWMSATSERKERLRSQLQATAFLVGENAATGETQYLVPGRLYFRSEGLGTYFEGNPSAWFTAETYRPWLDQLRDLVRTSVAIVTRRRDYRGYVSLVSGWGQHERGVDGFDPRAHIDGLDFALGHPNDARSEYVWNELLAPNRHLVEGVVESATRQDFSMAARETMQSPIGTIATTRSWLPSPDGSFHRPAALHLVELPPSYKRDEVLAKALKMVQPVIEEASRQLGVPTHVLRALSADPELLARIEEELDARKRGIADDLDVDVDVDVDVGAGSDDDVDFAVALREVFGRPGRPSRHDERDAAPPSGLVGNPETRRERTREAIGEDKAGEPASHERFRRVPRRVWEAKDSAVRHFLLEQYQGHCQICATTFEKRDGTPYFEGLYLVSRTGGRWLDRPGNVICLCATCCAKFQHGPVSADNVTEQIGNWRTTAEGGGPPTISLTLCDEDVTLQFTERHLLDLQEILHA